LGAEFVLVRIDEPILDNEELVREVSDCKTIGDAFSSGFLIAWPSAFVSYFLSLNILESFLCTFHHQLVQFYFSDSKEGLSWS
jgi:hypothetical protein